MTNIFQNLILLLMGLILLTFLAALQYDLSCQRIQSFKYSTELRGLSSERYPILELYPPKNRMGK